MPVLENGPYVVFAPNNDAFAALDPAKLEELKADPAALSKLDYYHAFLGLVGPDLVQGMGPSQEGTDITIKGKGGDIKVNDTAKVICGGIAGANSRIYIIDSVLDPDTLKLLRQFGDAGSLFAHDVGRCFASGQSHGNG